MIIIIMLESLSIIILSAGLWMLYLKINLKKNGIRTIGKVIRNEKYVESSIDSLNQVINITVYRPVVEFKTEEGLILQAICDEGSNPPLYKEGDEINIVYPSNNPDFVILSKNIDEIELPMTVIGIGIMMLIFSTILFFL